MVLWAPVFYVVPSIGLWSYYQQKARQGAVHVFTVNFRVCHCFDIKSKNILLHD